MVTTANKINFQAKWTAPIDHIKPNPSNNPLCKRVYELAKCIIFFIPNAILEPMIRWCILPSSSSLLKRIFLQSYIQDFRDFWHNGSKDPKNLWNKVFKPANPIASEFQSTYSPIEITMTTPDDIPLKGHFLKHKNHDSSPNSRVIILFHGNSSMYQVPSTWMMDLLKTTNTPYSFLLFNPRGVGESIKGVANSRNLLLDTETAYQLVTEELKIPENRIDLYGYSLGGAQAVHLKSLHPNTGGKVLLDRTFSSLDVEIFYTLGRLPTFIKNLAIRAIKKFGWEFNSYEAMKKIRDEVHIFYHMKDNIIPESCSLGKAVSDNNPNPTRTFVHKYDNDSPIMSWYDQFLTNLNLKKDTSSIGWHNRLLTDLNLTEDPYYHGTPEDQSGVKEGIRLLRDIFDNRVLKHVAECNAVNALIAAGAEANPAKDLPLKINPKSEESTLIDAIAS